MIKINARKDSLRTFNVKFQYQNLPPGTLFLHSIKIERYSCGKSCTNLNKKQHASEYLISLFKEDNGYRHQHYMNFAMEKGQIEQICLQ